MAMVIGGLHLLFMTFCNGDSTIDEDDKDFPLACMTIYQTVTERSNQITYASHRTKTTGHADEFWAIGLAMWQAEPFNPERTRNFSIETFH